MLCGIEFEAIYQIKKHCKSSTKRQVLEKVKKVCDLQWFAIYKYISPLTFVNVVRRNSFGGRGGGQELQNVQNEIKSFRCSFCHFVKTDRVVFLQLYSPNVVFKHRRYIVRNMKPLLKYQFLFYRKKIIIIVRYENVNIFCNLLLFTQLLEHVSGLISLINYYCVVSRN